MADISLIGQDILRSEAPNQDNTISNLTVDILRSEEQSIPNTISSITMDILRLERVIQNTRRSAFALEVIG